MRLRESVRALVLDPDDHVLLVRFHWDGLEFEEGFWANPGGGLEPGETRAAALRRELAEECGLPVEEIGPEIWTKTAHFDVGRWDGQVDHIHLVRTQRIAPRPGKSAVELAAENIHEIRWWSPEEIANGDEVFAPRRFPDLFAKLLTEGVPPEPVEILGF